MNSERQGARLLCAGLSLVLLIAGCIMAARFHAFAGVLILLMCAMVIWFGVLAG